MESLPLLLPVDFFFFFFGEAISYAFRKFYSGNLTDIFTVMATLEKDIYEETGKLK